MDNTWATFRISLSRAELEPDQATIRAHVEFTARVSGDGGEHHGIGGPVTLPFAGWHNFHHTYDRERYAQQLTHGLFANEAAHIAFEHYDNYMRSNDKPGRIIVHLRSADPLLDVVEWELLRHPAHPGRPLIDASSPLFRTQDTIRRSAELQDLPSPEQLKLLFAFNNLDHENAGIAIHGSDAPIRVESFELRPALLKGQLHNALALVFQPLLSLEGDATTKRLYLWAYDGQEQLPHTFPKQAAQFGQPGMPPVVFLLHDNNSPPAATMLAAAQLQRAGAPIVVVLPQVIRHPAEGVLIAQRALEQLLVHGSLFPLHWWNHQYESTQPAIWLRRQDGRIFHVSLGALANQRSAQLTTALRRSEELDANLLRVLHRYMQTDDRRECLRLLKDSREIQQQLREALTGVESLVQRPLRPEPLLEMFRLEDIQSLTSEARAFLVNRPKRKGPRLRPRRVDITAPAHLPLHKRQVLTVKIVLPDLDRVPKANWIEKILGTAEMQSIDLRSVSFDVEVEAKGARIEGNAVQRVEVPPDLPAPSLYFSLIADEPGNVIVFVRVYPVLGVRGQRQAEQPLLTSSYLELVAVEKLRETATTEQIERSSALEIIGGAQDPLVPKAPPLQPTGLTIIVKPGQDALSYYTDLILYKPDDKDSVPLVQNQPVFIDTTRLNSLSLSPPSYGQTLTEAMLGVQSVLIAWRTAEAFSQGRRAPIRLRLHLTDDASLNAVRWETLTDPERKTPLAFSRNWLLSRYVTSKTLRSFALSEAVGDAPRVAIVVASPIDVEKFQLTPIVTHEELSALLPALNSCSINVVGDVENQMIHESPSITVVAQRATRAAIAAAADGTQMLFLVCHGVMRAEEASDANAEPYLLLECNDGTAVWISAKQFVDDLMDMRDPPRLVVLASCNSAGDGYNQTAQAVGPLLSREGVPAVLGFQGPVAVATVRSLIPALLTALLRSGNEERALDAALAAARVELQDSDWWQPVLWLRRDDGRAW